MRGSGSAWAGAVAEEGAGDASRCRLGPGRPRRGAGGNAARHPTRSHQRHDPQPVRTPALRGSPRWVHRDLPRYASAAFMRRTPLLLWNTWRRDHAAISCPYFSVSAQGCIRWRTGNFWPRIGKFVQRNRDRAPAVSGCIRERQELRLDRNRAAGLEQRDQTGQDFPSDRDKALGR